MPSFLTFDLNRYTLEDTFFLRERIHFFQAGQYSNQHDKMVQGETPESSLIALTVNLQCANLVDAPVRHRQPLGC